MARRAVGEAETIAAAACTRVDEGGSTTWISPRVRCRMSGPNGQPSEAGRVDDIARPGDFDRFNGSSVDPGTLTSKQVFFLL